MTATAIARRAAPDLFPRDSTAGAVLLGARIGLVGVWLAALAVVWNRDGIPFDAQAQLMWIGLGLLAFCVGRHPLWLLWVALDIVPFAAALLAYDQLRAWSYRVGFPTWWHPQIALDKVIGFGNVPTVWLQEHLKHAQVQWYDIAICLVYASYFFLPYVTAGVLWLRGRRQFYRWSLRYVALSFLCYGLFVLIPSAPPWAAARCTGADVTQHPAFPHCLYRQPQFTPDGGLLGSFTSHLPGAHPWIENLVWRGWGELHLSAAGRLIDDGHQFFDPVAAIPSLHVGATVMFGIFMWRRVTKWWRPLLVAYPLAMTFTLVYGAEHYVTDCIAGALAAWGVHVAANRVERWRTGKRAPDTLGSPSEDPLESSCPPTPMPTPVLPHGEQAPATTPSST